jgi:hypothetical protein
MTQDPNSTIKAYSNPSPLSPPGTFHYEVDVSGWDHAQAVSDMNEKERAFYDRLKNSKKASEVLAVLALICRKIEERKGLS